MKITLDDFLRSLKKEKNTRETAEKKVGGEEPLTEKQKLENRLGEIEEAFKNSPYRTYSGYKTVNAAKKEYDYPSDEELTETAKKQAAESAEAKKNAKIGSAAEKYRGYAEKAEEAEKSAEKAAAEIIAAYEKAKRKAENKALASGTGRSSIVENRLNGLTAASAEAVGEKEKEKDAKIEKIEADILKLAEKTAEEIGAIDENSEDEVKKTLKALQNAREKEAKETDEYNAKIEERRRKAAEELAKRRITATEESSEEYAEMLYDKLRSLYEYYYSLGKDAKKEVEADKDFIKRNVGDSGYAYLSKLFK